MYEETFKFSVEFCCSKAAINILVKSFEFFCIRVNLKENFGGQQFYRFFYLIGTDELLKNVVPIYTVIYNILKYHIPYSLNSNRYSAVSWSLKKGWFKKLHSGFLFIEQYINWASFHICIIHFLVSCRSNHFCCFLFTTLNHSITLQTIDAPLNSNIFQYWQKWQVSGCKNFFTMIDYIFGIDMFNWRVKIYMYIFKFLIFSK